MAGTGLSSHELNQPGTYRDVMDTTIVAQFKADDSSSKKLKALCEGADLLSGLPIYFLAWTTTPWTLPSNTALTVGAKIDYVIVRTTNKYTLADGLVVLAENLVDYA